MVGVKSEGACDMSQSSKNTVISMPQKPIRKQNAVERKRKERVKRKALNQVAITIHVDQKHRLAVRTFEAILNSGDELANRVLRYLTILNDKLPAHQRARLRLPKVNKTEARAALSNLLKFTKRKRSA